MDEVNGESGCNMEEVNGEKEKESYRKQVFKSNYRQIMNIIAKSNSIRPKLQSNNKTTRRLSNWLHCQFKRTNIPNDEQAKLEVLRHFFDDKPKQEKDDEDWNIMFKKLEEYKEEYHTVVISKKDGRNRKLYYWVAEQRRRSKSGKLLPKRQEKLILSGLLQKSK